MRNKNVFLLCLCFFFLSGCDMFGTPLNTMQPPQLTKEQEEIRKAIENQLPTNSKIVDPIQYGSSLPLYNTVDLDGDSKEEVIVFHLNPPQHYLYSASIFKEINNQWTKIDTLDIATKNIEKLVFEDVTNDERTDIIIGTLNETNDKRLFVYQLNNTNINRSLEISYKEFTIGDLDSNGKAELYTLAFPPKTSKKRKKDSLFVNQYAFDNGNLYIKQQHPVRNTKYAYYSLQSETIAPNKKGLILNTYQNSETNYLTIYYMQNESLTMIPDEVIQPFHREFFPTQLKDSNSDGIMEFSAPMLPKGLIGAQHIMNEQPYVTGYYQWNGNEEFQLVGRHYYEENLLYDFTLPSEWPQKINVIKKDNYILFFNGDKEKNLFNIQVIPIDQWGNDPKKFILKQTKKHVFVSTFPTEKYRHLFQAKE
jgi:hypothetical protein